MNDALESALIIELTDAIKWGAALPVADTTTGRMTQVDPGQPFNVLDYARRDREFQHRDMINAMAVAKVSLHAQTVWNGTMVFPRLQGATSLTNSTGTNIQLPIDPQELPSPLPVASTQVMLVGNGSVPYDAVRVTDKGLYSRDVLLYETLARAASIFPDPPVRQNDAGGSTVGSTSVWTVGDPGYRWRGGWLIGTTYIKNDGVQSAGISYICTVDSSLGHIPASYPDEWSLAPGPGAANFPDAIPNAAQALDAPLFTTPDRHLMGQDNQVAAYVARIAQALKNPFSFATRIYVSVTGADVRESETYVLTNDVYTYATSYAAGQELLYLGLWYRANYTTGDIPLGSSAWTPISGPSTRQFIADPSLANRNRIVYNIASRTLQWFREDTESIHVPQIVGFYVPGVLPNQYLSTNPLVPEPKDAQFWRQKAGRVSFADGTWESVASIYPTSGTQTSNDQGAIDTLFQSAKAITFMMPSATTITFNDTVFSAGTYAMTALVRPSSSVNIAGIDRLSGGISDLNTYGVNYTSLNTTLQYNISLPAGGWNLYIEYTNDDSATSDSLGFGVTATLNSTNVLTDAMPLYFTDSRGNPLPKNTLVMSTPIAISSAGGNYTLNLKWTAGVGVFHIRRLVFSSTTNDTSHYVMSATWSQAVAPLDYTSTLDVLGQRDVPDVMPFTFYLASAGTASINLAWNPASATPWNSTQTYYPGDQVLYVNVYWRAADIIPANSPPGVNGNWEMLGREPQIPLVIENIHLQRWRPTAVTPLTTGFSGFRQDMLDRANRSDQDAYRRSVASSGTAFPEFRVGGTAWEYESTGSWMSYMEVYNPRLREVPGVPSGNIVLGHSYLVGGNSSLATVTYDAVTYGTNQTFDGVSGVSAFSASGGATVTQIGAYRRSAPGDVGQPALIPAGLEYILSAGTVAGWYASYASYPTVQALQPWMVERGFYVAQPEFWSPPTL